ncbi:hypothetical protein Ae201684P_005579 [Aphanomyces euteiches]|uniref:Uncharacterized protein n=1 Tax=Aphanomyces euteiches TaxID=100861 RepID=A0A6G0W911_9STRA|nr:hypothetical protein Ae201684_017458 [Aphanomyces euteiches]KAH9085881.1 hypothetical protein Ae201684P_005579 [Aphanomyces euteiches]
MRCFYTRPEPTHTLKHDEFHSPTASSIPSDIVLKKDPKSKAGPTPATSALLDNLFCIAAANFEAKFPVDCSYKMEEYICHEADRVEEKGKEIVMTVKKKSSKRRTQSEQLEPRRREAVN